MLGVAGMWIIMFANLASAGLIAFLYTNKNAFRAAIIRRKLWTFTRRSVLSLALFVFMHMDVGPAHSRAVCPILSTRFWPQSFVLCRATRSYADATTARHDAIPQYCGMSSTSQCEASSFLHLQGSRLSKVVLSVLYLAIANTGAQLLPCL